MKVPNQSELACGHSQIISDTRIRLAKQGVEQPKVWCVTCDDWTEVVPIAVPEDKESNE